MSSQFENVLVFHHPTMKHQCIWKKEFSSWGSLSQHVVEFIFYYLICISVYFPMMNNVFMSIHRSYPKQFNFMFNTKISSCVQHQDFFLWNVVCTVTTRETIDIYPLLVFWIMSCFLKLFQLLTFVVIFITLIGYLVYESILGNYYGTKIASEQLLKVESLTSVFYLLAFCIW